VGFPKAKKGSDADDIFDWNKYYEMYKERTDIQKKWNELFNTNSTAYREEFFELAKMFDSSLEYDDFDEFIQYADELFWGLIDKAPSAITKEDVKKAEKRFVHFLIGFW